MAATSTHQDDFEFGGLDTGKWSTWGSISISATTELLLQLVSTLAANYGGVLSLSTYDLTGSYVFSQLVDAGNQSLASLEVYPIELTTGTDALAIMVNGNQVYARKKIAGSYTTVGASIAYNSTTMKWFRIRESAGQTYWEYAADPAGSWTEITTHVANPITVTSLTIGVTLGTWQVEGSTSTVKVDNVNVLPGQYQFSWMGYTWNKRIQTGPSMYNNNWSPSNISGPDGNGYLTLSVTNPGSAPVGAEIFSATRGFGYGTYVCTVGTRGDNIHKAIVLGGMFTFDFTSPPDYKEIDMGEIRDYNGNTNIRVLYSHVWNNGGAAFITDDVDITSDNPITYRCVWTPTKIIYSSHIGDDIGGTVLQHYEHESRIQTTNLERVHFNVWVQNAHTPAGATPTDLILRRFQFTPFNNKISNTTRYLKVGNNMSTSSRLF